MNNPNIEEIINSKYSDEEFLDIIKSMPTPDLEDLRNAINEVRDDCTDRLKEASDKFRNTGIPANTVWIEKTKKQAAIRTNHIMMISRQLTLRGPSEENEHSEEPVAVGELNTMETE